MVKPRITVVIPAFNEAALIGATIDSVKKQTLNQKYYEILVVDNNSTDDTAKIALSKGARVVKETKKGYVQAVSRGAEEARGEIIAYIDADCRARPDWLKRLVEHFEKDPSLDAVGGIFSFFDATKFMDFWAWVTIPLNWHLIGGNYAIKKASLKRIGGFDKSVNFSQDVRLTLVLKEKGKFLIDKSLFVETSVRRFEENLFGTLYKYLMNDLSLVVFRRPMWYDFSDVRPGRKYQDLLKMPIFRFGAMIAAFLLAVTLIALPTLTSAKSPIYKGVQNIRDTYTQMANAVGQRVKDVATYPGTKKPRHD